MCTQMKEGQMHNKPIIPPCLIGLEQNEFSLPKLTLVQFSDYLHAFLASELALKKIRLPYEAQIFLWDKGFVSFRFNSRVYSVSVTASSKAIGFQLSIDIANMVFDI